ncbi:MAG: hypothetical protein JSR46_09415, partial [Verrucomicrobia bacterium]|nr:hypothetical protein [Verrucomicrobiota bacterium]
AKGATSCANLSLVVVDETVQVTFADFLTHELEKTLMSKSEHKNEETEEPPKKEKRRSIRIFTKNSTNGDQQPPPEN